MTPPTIGHAETWHSTAGWTPEDFGAVRSKLGTCGASDSFAVLYGSRLELAMTHKGLAPRFTGNDLSQLGQLSEPAALRWLADYLGRPVQAADCILLHPTIRVLHCTPDGFTVGPDGLEGVECKWTAARNRDGVEILCEHGPHYAMGHVAFRAWVQACHSLAVTGLDKWWVCWVVGGQAGMRALGGLPPAAGDFNVHPVRRDDPDVASMIAVIEREIPAFWAQYINGDELPAPNPDAWADLRAIGKAYRVDAGLEVDAPDLADDCRAYVDARNQARTWKDTQDRHRAAILDRMGPAAVADVPGFNCKRSKSGSLLVTERAK